MTSLDLTSGIMPSAPNRDRHRQQGRRGFWQWYEIPGATTVNLAGWL